MFKLYISAGRYWWTGVQFLRQGPKPDSYPILAKINQKLFCTRFTMWTKGPINGGFGWVSRCYEYSCGWSCQNWCGSIFQPTVTILITALDCCLWDLAITSKIMVGWDDDAFHSQVICNKPLCLPPTTFLFLWMLNEIQLAVVPRTQKYDFWSEMNTKYLIWKGCRGQHQTDQVH